MTGKQHTVMWLGVLLITIRLLTTGQGKAIWQLVTTGSPSTGGTGPDGGSTNPLPPIPGFGRPGGNTNPFQN